MKEYKKYAVLNELAKPNGTVIFGGKDDLDIPLGELKQAFAWEPNCYNRSVCGLSVTDATTVYAACVASLHPQTVLLHLGAADTDLFLKSPEQFAQCYRELITQVRKGNPRCHIAIISLKGHDDNIVLFNKYLKYIAQSESCDYYDISEKRVWSPRQAREVVSFLHEIGFVRPLKSQQPLGDLVRALFCFNG